MPDVSSAPRPRVALTSGRDDAAPGGEPQVRLRLDVAYDGTEFSGWARQPGLRTVQGELTEALQTALRSPVVVTVAGRTDAGVHARGQVCHVDVPAAAWEALPGRSARIPGESLVARLAGLLAPDVVVGAAQVAPEGFDARFSAIWRRYTYRIHDAAAPDPLTRTWVLWHRRAVDAAAMNAAAQALLGEHDFLAYCKPREGATTIRTLQELSVRREGGRVIVGVRADAFCHSMVRSLVGALLAVGEGRREVDWPGQMLRARERNPAVAVAPACGLVLEEVGYPGASDLAARAATARAVRTLPGR